jgi:hypothetical protein
MDGLIPSIDSEFTNNIVLVRGISWVRARVDSGDNPLLMVAMFISVRILIHSMMPLIRQGINDPGLVSYLARGPLKIVLTIMRFLDRAFATLMSIVLSDISATIPNDTYSILVVIVLYAILQSALVS